MMKKIILLTFLIGIFALPVWAQRTEGPVTLYKDVDNVPNNSAISEYFSNELFIYANQLATDANSVAIINTVGNHNKTTIKQIGTNNVGVIRTRGSHNTTKLTQTGNNLTSFIGIDGKSNKLFVTQNGDNLGNKILLEGSGMKFRINQFNTAINKDMLKIRKIGGEGVPLKITHSGGTIPIIISNN